MPELDLGNVKGPQGKSAYQSALDAGYSGSEEAFNTAMAKAPDAVLYTAQSLTDEQKAQARGNINAAPGGFGLGGNATNIPAGADLNSYVKTGRYAQGTTLTMRQILNLPDAFSNGGIVVDVLAITPTYVMQIAYNLRDNKDIITAMRQNYVGTWQPWEYVNPPMELGIEYRTTERYLGKPVYCQLVNFGALPNATTKRFRHDIPGISAVIAVYGSAGDQVLSPGAFGGGLLTIAADNTDIQIKTSGDYSAYVAYVALKYTK